VGLGLLASAIGLLLVVAFLLLFPRDRPASEAAPA